MKTSEIQDLLVRFYRNYSSNIPEVKRERRLARIKQKVRSHDRRDISEAAKTLAGRNDDMPYLFKTWCDIVMLTGEV